jgi:hypothetical protein
MKIDKDNRHVDIEHFKAIDHLKNNYPGRSVKIAAFPTFALEKVYFLRNFKTDEKDVYNILFPGEFEEKFKINDPNGRVIKNISTVYSLFVN